jgi:PPOX class probable F420-dependent enzyme
MTKQIPEQFLDLFKKKAFAHLATLMPDGSPQVTPVWVDYDGRYLIVNSARGRQKDRNIARDQRVALAISDPDNPYRALKVRGRVVEITEVGAREGIDHLSVKYTGEKYKHLQPGEVRVIYRIEPLHIS